MATHDDRRAIFEGCDRFLSRGARLGVAQSLEQLAGAALADERPDSYGAGDSIDAFEREVAELLGKPAAVFMPSGTMAQQIALRIHCDRVGVPSVAYHPTCHLEIHEQHGLRELHGLSARLLGARSALMTSSDLESLAGDVSALLVELPQREIGGALPSWTHLNELIAVALTRGMAVHLDGARLWECEPFYQRTIAEIGSLFDTVYVSFYKTLGGIAGAMLAGCADFIAEAKVWQRRYGGNLVHLYPYVVSARSVLRERLPKIRSYVERARAIAEVICAVPGVSVSPRPVVTNMMHVFIAANREAVDREAVAIAREEKVQLFGSLRSCPVPGVSMFEASIGDAAEDLTDAELTKWFTRLASAS